MNFGPTLLSSLKSLINVGWFISSEPIEKFIFVALNEWKFFSKNHEKLQIERRDWKIQRIYFSFACQVPAEVTILHSWSLDFPFLVLIYLFHFTDLEQNGLLEFSLFQFKYAVEKALKNILLINHKTMDDLKKKQ